MPGGRPSSPGQASGYFRLLWLCEGGAELPSSRPRPVEYMRTISHVISLPASRSCRLAPGKGRSREVGLPNPVCPGQRAASAQVPVPVCANWPHSCTPPRLRAFPSYYEAARPSGPSRINLHLPSTPATPGVSTTKPAHQQPRSPFDRPLPPPHRPPLQAHGGALARGARRDARPAAKW